MAKCTVFGIEQFYKNMQTLDKETRNIVKGGLAEGAGYAADELRDALDTLPIRPDKYEKRQHSQKLRGVTESEFAQITNNFGIAHFKESGGSWNTSVGFHGTVHTPSPMFNDEVPTGMLVQCVEYGTEFRQGVHLLSKAINKSKDTVAQKIQDYIDKETEKILK